MDTRTRSEIDADLSEIGEAMAAPIAGLHDGPAPSNDDLIDAIGADAAAELCDRLGGLSINLPHQIVVDVLGEDAASVFHARFGPGRFYFPMSIDDRKSRDAKIVRLVEEGHLTRQQIARKLRVTERTVYNALERARNAAPESAA